MSQRKPAQIALMAHRLAVDHPTGIGRYTVEVASCLHEEAMARGDFSISVAAPPEPAEPEWLPPGLPRHTLRGPRRLRAAISNLTYRPEVDRELGNPDLVHALYPWAPVPTSRPLVLTIHDLIPSEHPEWYSWKEHFMYQRALRYALRRASRVVCDSRYVARRAVDAGFAEDRIRVVYLGIGDEFRSAAAMSPLARQELCRRYRVTEGRYFIAVGAVSDRKNVGLLIEALKGAEPRGALERVPLLVAGPDGLEADAIRRQIEQHGLADQVRLIGFVPHEDLPGLLASAVALLHPSLDEGFGFTPLEAMAAGTPVISSNAASLPEVVGEAGIVLRPDDPRAWTEAMQAVIAEPQLRGELVVRGRSQAARFTWTRTAAELFEIYAEVLCLTQSSPERGSTSAMPHGGGAAAE